MYALANRLDPTSYRALARATFAEMACAGITCVGEFHYLHHGAGGTPYDEANAMGEAVRAAAAEAGVRLTLLDTCYLHGGIGVAPNETQRRFSDGDAHAWAARVEAMPASANMIVGAAIHSVRAVDPRASAIVADWAARAEAPLHAHVSEQPGENAHCQDAYGMSPIERLHRDGALSDRFTAVHATHLSEHDVALLAATHSVCCLCPTTERDLADGIGPTRQFRDSGIAMTLGSDSHAVIDLFEEARAVELDERLASLERGTHAPAALLTAATAAGYRSLGWPDGGRLTPGALADLTTISLDSVRLAGAPYDDLLAAVVYSGGAADVHHVVVGGKVIVRDGAHVQLDVPRELNTAITEVWS
jgi:formiminoglutamate deiminase